MGSGLHVGVPVVAGGPTIDKRGMAEGWVGRCQVRHLRVIGARLRDGGGSEVAVDEGGELGLGDGANLGGFDLAVLE